MNLPPPPPPGPMVPPGFQPYGFNRREHEKGTTVLVLGILSLVVCGVLGPIAWVMGNNALREMNAQPGVQWSNRGNVTAGRVCGIVSTCLLAAGVLIAIIAVIAVAITAH